MVQGGRKRHTKEGGDFEILFKPSRGQNRGGRGLGSPSLERGAICNIRIHKGGGGG